MKIKKLLLDTVDNYKINAIINESDTHTRDVIVMTHGIFTDKHEKGRYDILAERLCKSGYTTIRFDFRGHGESSIDSRYFNIDNAVSDYKTVLTWVQALYSNIFVIGSSFGGSIVLLERLLTIKNDIKGFILLNPVIDYTGTFTNSVFDWEGSISQNDALEIFSKGYKEQINNFFFSFLFYTQLSTIIPYKGISLLEAPTLVFHGELDDKVSVEFAKNHFSNVKNVELDILLNSGHAFKDKESQEYIHEKITNWLNNHNK